jgi:hypothetical protein
VEYYVIVGMVAVAFVLLFGFISSFKKSIEEEKKPIQELNNSIIRLNINFENMLANDKTRDERIGNHGKEIDKLENRVLETEHELSNHEGRIQSLEKWREKRG